jgi:hypothetical protein
MDEAVISNFKLSQFNGFQQFAAISQSIQPIISNT